MKMNLRSLIKFDVFIANDFVKLKKVSNQQMEDLSFVSCVSLDNFYALLDVA